ncbi:Nitrite reductase [NAD(P)H], partial [Durusdinium trenchii]
MSDYEITVISAETDHFFSRTALMYIYMGHMKYENTKPYEDWFWEKNRINLVRKFVKEVDTNNKKLTYEDGGSIDYDVLILGVGSKSNKFGWPGQDLEGVQGLYSYQDLETMEKNSQGITRAVIVGGGLIGIEMTEMLLSRKIPVTFLVREENFWDPVFPIEEAKMINRHIHEHHVDLRLSTELKEILDDGNGRVKAVTTKDGEEIDCQLVGLTVGVSPNIDFLKESNVETDRGIMVDEYLQTNLPDVYAIGD